jgi:hypothetical protein
MNAKLIRHLLAYLGLSIIWMMISVLVSYFTKARWVMPVFIPIGLIVLWIYAILRYDYPTDIEAQKKAKELINKGDEIMGRRPKEEMKATINVPLDEYEELRRELEDGEMEKEEPQEEKEDLKETINKMRKEFQEAGKAVESLTKECEDLKLKMERNEVKKQNLLEERKGLKEQLLKLIDKQTRGAV